MAHPAHLRTSTWLGPALTLVLVCACVVPSPGDAGNAADTDAADTSAVDAAAGSDGAGGDAAARPDAAAEDSAASGLPCSFNADCPAQERCACDEIEGCACALGPRGTGINGVDTCETGDDCASSLCVEGPGGVYYCSDACQDASDCGPMLPVCADIAFVGRICIRG